MQKLWHFKQRIICPSNFYKVFNVMHSSFKVFARYGLIQKHQTILVQKTAQIHDSIIIVNDHGLTNVLYH